MVRTTPVTARPATPPSATAARGLTNSGVAVVAEARGVRGVLIAGQPKGQRPVHEPRGRRRLAPALKPSPQASATVPVASRARVRRARGMLASSPARSASAVVCFFRTEREAAGTTPLPPPQHQHAAAPCRSARPPEGAKRGSLFGPAAASGMCHPVRHVQRFPVIRDARGSWERRRCPPSVHRCIRSSRARQAGWSRAGARHGRDVRNGGRSSSGSPPCSVRDRTYSSRPGARRSRRCAAGRRSGGLG